MLEHSDCQDPGDRPVSRAAVYIDGFNLYYSISDLRQNHLKWINLRKLAEIIIPRRSEALVKVAFFYGVQ